MTAQIYERLSAVYDLEWGKWARPYTDINQDALRCSGVSRGRLLDLACGTGTLAVELGERGHSVLGVDISSRNDCT